MGSFTKYSALVFKLVAPVTLGMMVLSVSAPAEAYTRESGSCGKLKWAATTKMVRYYCTMPDGSDSHRAYNNAGWQWWNTGRHVIDYKWKSCTIGDENGRNETAITSASALSGKLGLTAYIYNSDCEFEEADVYMANTLSFAQEDESFYGYDPYTSGDIARSLVQGPVALLHEFGHVVGLDHSLNFNVMRTSPPLPLSGDQPQPAPDDAAGIRSIYPGNNVTNVYASSQYRAVVGSKDYIVATPNFVLSGPVVSNNCITIWASRGSGIDVRYTLMNNGTSTVTNTGFRIFLNDSPFNYGGGWNMFSGGATINPNNGFTESRFVAIPNVPNGLYWILWEVDSNHTTAEYNEGDNSVHSCMTVQVTG